jgi:uncharacterized protein YybS (DUF2232 family)
MQSRNYSTKAVVEAGLLSVIIVVLMLTTAYIPFLSILNVLLPVPVTILYLRHNYKVAICSVIVSGIIVSTLYSPVLALGVIVTYSLAGMTLGYCIKRDKKVSHTIMLLALASAIANVITTLLFVFVIQPNGVQGFISYINKALFTLNSNIEQTKEAYKAAGMSAKQLSTLNQIPPLTIANIMLILPGTFVLTCAFDAIISYSITKAILKKLKYKVKGFKPFSEFYINNRIGALAIILFCIALLLKSRNMAIGEYALGFLTIIILSVLLISGLALTTFFLRNRFILSKKIVILIILITFIMGLGQIFLILGFMDMIIDYRRLDADRLFKR